MEKAVKILLVEDDAFIANLGSNALIKAGFDLVRVATAEEAVSSLKSRRPDIILLDLVLPGKDGFTLLSELKKDEENKDIPVMIISNLGSKEEMDRGLLLGAIAYYVKSNTMPEEIIRKIKEVLKIN